MISLNLSVRHLTHQLEEVGNDGEEETGEHRTHRFGSLLYQCNGDLNSLQGRRINVCYSTSRTLIYLSQEDKEADNDEKENPEDHREGQPGITLFENISKELGSYVRF